MGELISPGEARRRNRRFYWPAARSETARRPDRGTDRLPTSPGRTEIEVIRDPSGFSTATVTVSQSDKPDAKQKAFKRSEGRNRRLARLAMDRRAGHRRTNAGHVRTGPVGLSDPQLGRTRTYTFKYVRSGLSGFGGAPDKAAETTARSNSVGRWNHRERAFLASVERLIEAVSAAQLAPLRLLVIERADEGAHIVGRVLVTTGERPRHGIVECPREPRAEFLPAWRSAARCPDMPCPRRAPIDGAGDRGERHNRSSRAEATPSPREKAVC